MLETLFTVSENPSLNSTVHRKHHKAVWNPFRRKSQYACYVLLTPPEAPAVWTPSTWPPLAACLDELVTQSASQPHVQARLLESGDARPFVRLGRLTWDTDATAPWLTKDADSPVFHSLVVTSPSLAVCQKQKRVPDLFFCLFNRKEHLADYKLAYSVVLCVRDDPDLQPLVTPAVRQLSAVIRPSHTFHKMRPWGYFWGSSENDTCSIHDYQVIMPMYNERHGEPIGEPLHGWTHLAPFDESS